MADLKSVRRVYLHKRIAARAQLSNLEPVWQAKQEAEPGTALPASFPFLSELEAVGYTTREDLDGADADELVDHVSLSKRDAEAVIAAFQAL